MSIVEKNNRPKTGRKPLPKDKQKIQIGLRIEKWVYDALQDEANDSDFIEGVNPLIRSILRNYVSSKMAEE